MTTARITQQAPRMDRGSSLLARWEMDALANILEPNERVEEVVQGLYRSRNGVLVATDRRAIFIDKGLFGRTTVESFPYAAITSVEYETGLLWGRVAVLTANGGAEATMVNNAQVRSMAERLTRRTRVALPATDLPARLVGAVAESGSSIVFALERAADLMQRGMLTAEEFAKLKQKLVE